ncbi:11008_t:CDS:1, partial [Funneliformis mosseae]
VDDPIRSLGKCDQIIRITPNPNLGAFNNSDHESTRDYMLLYIIIKAILVSIRNLY